MILRAARSSPAMRPNLSTQKRIPSLQNKIFSLLLAHGFQLEIEFFFKKIFVFGGFLFWEKGKQTIL